MARGTQMSHAMPGALGAAKATIQKGGKPLRRKGSANVQPKSPKGGAIRGSKK